MPSSTFCVAAVQTVSGGEVAANLEQIAPLIAHAADAGAKLVLLPEYFGLMGARATDKLAVAEGDGDGPQQEFLARSAQRHAVYVVGGCVPIRSADPERVRSACLVYDPHGERVARYDKVHLFAFSDGAERYDEAQTIEPGDRAVAFESAWGRIALSIWRHASQRPRDLRPLDARRSVGQRRQRAGHRRRIRRRRSRCVANRRRATQAARAGAPKAGGRKGRALIIAARVVTHRAQCDRQAAPRLAPQRRRRDQRFL
jgi:hypothetical protein